MPAHPQHAHPESAACSAATLPQGPLPRIWLRNTPPATATRVGPADAAAVLSLAMLSAARAAISARSDYRPTPLRAMPGLAQQLQLGGVWVKDESSRFGLGGVKALGAPYGLEVLLAAQPGPASAYTAVAATDGNHGLALAWAAARLGCQARIYVGSAVDPVRCARIRAAGATLVHIDGTYDAAVAAAAKAAEEGGVLLITDTDHQGKLPVTLAIMAGYSVLATEIAEQLAAPAVPGEPARPALHELTQVFLPCGVGGLAAGISAGLWAHLGTPPPVVTVEPVHAACLLASLEAGRPVSVPGDLLTRMLGLACGQPSLPAWQILQATVQAALAIDDAAAATTQQLLARGLGSDAPLRSGDTGIAALAGLCQAAADAGSRRQLGLNRQSQVLVLSSEGPLPGSA